MSEETYNYLMFSLKLDIKKLEKFELEYPEPGNRDRLLRLKKIADELILIKERGCMC